LREKILPQKNLRKKLSSEKIFRMRKILGKNNLFYKKILSREKKYEGKISTEKFLARKFFSTRKTLEEKNY
jgi:hypothetical protein